MDSDNRGLMEKFFRLSRLLRQSHRWNGGECGSGCRGQGWVLSLLREHPEIGQKELSALLDIRPQSLGELLARLEESGCILRTPAEADRRAMDIRLTPKGLLASARAEENRAKSAALFDCLSAEEKDQLDGILDRLTAEFKKTAQD